MAKDNGSAEGEQGTAAVEADDKTPRVPTEYVAFSLNADGTLQPLEGVTALGQQAAKKAVAVRLANDEAWAEVLQGAGVQIVVAPAKSWQPELVRIAVPAPRVTVGA